MSAIITSSSISKSFGDTQVLADITFSVERADTLSLVGPSGCGKTTLLHILAGIQESTAGHYTVSGKHSIVFQDPRLFPWRTVRRNITIANDISADSIPAEQVDRLLDMTGLSAYQSAYPHELSGGMRQRAAFARAMAVEPEVMFLDEPFGSLDYLTKKQLQQEFRTILDETGRTAIYVTHNIRDAVRLGDRIAVLDQNPCTFVESWETDQISDISEVEECLEQSY